MVYAALEGFATFSLVQYGSRFYVLWIIEKKEYMMNMKHALTMIAAAGYLLMATTVGATIITFDDHPNVIQNRVGDVGNYAGFDFNLTLDWIDTVGSGWNYGAVSGEFSMLNNSGGMGIITEESGNDFTFGGLHSRVWSTNSDRQGTIRGFNNGVEVWTSTIDLTQTWTQYSGVAGSIDELRLDLGNFFLVDDIYINETIPEPATLGLMGFSTIGMLFYRRRGRFFSADFFGRSKRSGVRFSSVAKPVAVTGYVSPVKPTTSRKERAQAQWLNF